MEVSSEQLDPLSLAFVDVFDLILQHFKATDVISASTVSKSWYEIIGSSSHCMRQIWLRIDKPEAQIEVLRKSKRKYEKFKIQPGQRKELSKVMHKFRPKVAVITDDDEVDFDDYCALMESIAPTVEILQPGEGIIKNAYKMRYINFPKLREIQCTVVDRLAFSVFLGNTPKLKKVLLSFDQEIPSSLIIPVNVIQNFFCNNPQLNCLWLCDLDCLFIQNIAMNTRLDLETFAFGKLGKFSPQIKKNFMKFFKTQRNLEWLKIMSLQDRDVFIEIWNEENFKRLFIMDCTLKGNLFNTELARNNKIIEINFYLNPSGQILRFLKATPNLKSFRVRQLSKQILEFCVYNLHYLELIQFQSIEKDGEIYFIHLQEQNIKRIQLEKIDFFEFVGRDVGF